MNRAGSSRLIAGLTCLAAAACARTSPATRAAEGAAPAPLPAALADGGAAGYRLRVLLARHHRARVEPRGGGPWSEADQVGLNAFTPAVKGPYPYVVVEPGAWPRVLSEYGGVRLLLYVDPADAQPVAVRTARLRPQADQPASGDVGVTIYPGLPVAVDESGRATKVHIEDDALRAEGWVDATDMGILYEPVVAAPPGAPQVLLQASTPLLMSPGGPPLAATTSSALLACQVLAPAQAGFTKVLIRSIDTASDGIGTLNYEVRAFVPTSALGSPGGAGNGSAGGLPIAGYSETFTLPPATRLYDHPHGSVVGVTVGNAASAWRLGPRQDDWQGLWVPTPWGALTLWMARAG